MTARWPRALQTALMALGLWLAALTANAASNVFVAGTFNDWNPTHTAWQLQPVTNDVWELEQFFPRDRHELKFVVDDQWRGQGASGRLVTGGENIRWDVTQSGVYRITLDWAQRDWRAQRVKADRPYAVLRVRGTPAVNRPFWLDASDSIPRTGRTNLTYRFWQDEADTVRAELPAAPTATPRARVTVPREGNYRFWLVVDDGQPSEPVSVMVRAERSYQVVGDWTAPDPINPATYLRQVEPGVYERWLRSESPGEYQLLLIRNHDPAVVLHFLTVSVTQTNTQHWRVRYDENTDELACEPVAATEFVFDPEDFPVLIDRGTVIESVHLAGTFNDWSTSRHPMERQSDGTYRIMLPLAEGLYHYKFVVNGTIWLTDHRADPTLGADDGHGGRNAGVYVGRRGSDYGEPQPQHVLREAVQVVVNRVSSELIEVSVRTLAQDVQRVEVEFGSSRRALRRSSTAFGFDHWRGELFAGTNITAVSVHVIDGEAREVFGPAEVPALPLFPTPDWAKHVVWYQIFPERFANGTPENDPPRVLPWRWDWYRFAPWERPNETRTFSPDWYNRWFGGDLQGIIRRLGYLRELGVTALYLCPVFEARSYHGYDTTDYRHVMRWFGFRESFPAETLDPTTWQWTKSDRLFLEFLQRARAAGMKVIVDAVFNHMGRDSFALQDVLTNGVQSLYADWFDVTDWGPPVRYNSWDGGGWMPNFRKNQRHGIASASAREYLFNVTRRWMDPNGDGDPSDGVDGWRLDVAADVPEAFWRDWRKLVKSINPNAYIVGEHWGEPVHHLKGDQWDATMNYAFAVRAIRFFIDRDRKISASEFDRQLRELREKYPLQVNFVMQNLYDSHDTDRLVNMIINPDRDYDAGNRPQDGHAYDGSKPGSAAYQVLKLMATFQMTYLGAPMIWYGTEVGMYGADDPTNRKPMIWADLGPYENPRDSVMNDVLEHYRRLIAIRNTWPALRTGLYRTLLTDDERDVLAFARVRADQTVVVILNNSDKPQTVEVPVPFGNGTRLVDALTATPAQLTFMPADQLGFPDYAPGTTLRALRLGAGAMPSYPVREGFVRVGLERKSAVILVSP